MCFWKENFFLFPLQRFNSPNDHLLSTSPSNPLSYLFLPQRAANKRPLARNRSSETATPLRLSGHVTSFYNLCDMLISRCFTGGGIDFQMMTLFLVKSTLVSRCVCTREIVCLISRITVSSAYFLFKALREASELILNGIHHSSFGEILQLLS